MSILLKPSFLKLSFLKLSFLKLSQCPMMLMGTIILLGSLSPSYGEQGMAEKPVISAPEGGIPQMTPAQHAAKEALITSLLQLKTLRASFKQYTGNDAPKSGQLYLMRPGKLKMHIIQPREELLIVKNNWLVHHIPLMDETTHLPLNDTPARIFLEADDALKKRLEKAQILVGEKQTQLILQYQAEGLTGRLIMTFHAQTHQLEKWHVTDNNGNHTIVILSDAQQNTPIDANEFVFIHEQ